MWPFRREAKSLSNPTNDLFEIFTGVPTGSIGAGSALTVPAVSAAIRLISEAAATLQVRVKKRDGDSEVDVPDHPAAMLLGGQVNGWTSAFELVRDLTAQALIADNGGLAYVTKVRRQVREIIHYRPSFIQVEYDSATGEPSYKLDSQPVNAADVIHVRGPFHRSPLNLALEAIGAGKAMETYVSGLFSNGARPSGFLSTEKQMQGPALENLRALWTNAFGGAANAGKTPVLPEGLKFQQLALTSTDSQFLENRKFQILEIARAFRVPPSMLFELDRATWSNGEQQGKEFLTYTLEPWLHSLEAAFNRALLTDSERKTHRIVFDRDDLTRADIGQRATAYSSMISARIINPNEARSWEGLPSYDGGDQFANPNTGSNQPGQPPGADKAANDNGAVDGNARAA